MAEIEAYQYSQSFNIFPPGLCQPFIETLLAVEQTSPRSVLGKLGVYDLTPSGVRLSDMPGIDVETLQKHVLNVRDLEPLNFPRNVIFLATAHKIIVAHFETTKNAVFRQPEQRSKRSKDTLSIVDQKTLEKFKPGTPEFEDAELLTTLLRQLLVVTKCAAAQALDQIATFDGQACEFLSNCAVRRSNQPK